MFYNIEQRLIETRKDYLETIEATYSVANVGISVRGEGLNTISIFHTKYCFTEAWISVSIFKLLHRGLGHAEVPPPTPVKPAAYSSRFIVTRSVYL